LSGRWYERKDRNRRDGHSQLPREWKDMLRADDKAREDRWFDQAVQEALSAD